MGLYLGKVERGRNMSNVTLRGSKTTVNVGEGYPVAVNVNVGVSTNNICNFETELEKVKVLSELSEKPDLMMDLSLDNSQGYLYDYIREQIGCPIGFIPHYLCLNDKGIIDRGKLKEEMIRAATKGVSWFVVHLTPNIERVYKAIKTRDIPFSSRSAVVIIKDMINRNASRSIYWDILNDVIDIAKKYSIVISLGAAFRPAVTKNTLDEVHTDELLEYARLIKIFRGEGIKVMVEGVGHCLPNKLNSLVSIINQLDVPFMPLGPLFTDAFSKDDHIVNSIGFYSGVLEGGNFSIINSITPAEHSGGIPNIEDILIGYKTARACSNLCNDFLGLSSKRLNMNRCSVVDGNSIGCNRCESICPTKFYISEKEKIERWIQKDLIY